MPCDLLVRIGSIFLIDLFQSFCGPSLYDLILFLHFIRPFPINNRCFLFLIPINIDLRYSLLRRWKLRIVTKTFAYFLRAIFLVILLFIYSHLHCDFVSSAIINLQLNPMGIITINEITICRLGQAYKTMISIRVLLII